MILKGIATIPTGTYLELIADDVGTRWHDIITDPDPISFFNKNESKYEDEFARQKQEWESIGGKIEGLNEKGEKVMLDISLEAYLKPFQANLKQIEDDRKNKIQKGIVVSKDIPFKTDETSITYMLGVCQLYPDDKVLNWKCADDVFRQVPVSDIKQALIACSDFVEDCFNSEMENHLSQW